MVKKLNFLTIIPGLIYFTQLEMAKAVSDIACVQSGKGNKKIYERYVYIANIFEMMKVIRIYGLFPSLKDNVANNNLCPPSIKHASDYFLQGNQENKDPFKKVLEELKKSATTHNSGSTIDYRSTVHIKRVINMKQFRSETRSSLLPILVLSLIANMAQNIDKTENNVLRGGNYVGSSKPSFPLAITLCQHNEVTEKDKHYIVKKIGECGLISTLQTENQELVLDINTIAGILFKSPNKNESIDILSTTATLAQQLYEQKQLLHYDWNDEEVDNDGDGSKSPKVKQKKINGIDLHKLLRSFKALTTAVYKNEEVMKTLSEKLNNDQLSELKPLYKQISKSQKTTMKAVVDLARKTSVMEELTKSLNTNFENFHKAVQKEVVTEDDPFISIKSVLNEIIIGSDKKLKMYAPPKKGEDIDNKINKVGAYAWHLEPKDVKKVKENLINKNLLILQVTENDDMVKIIKGYRAAAVTPSAVSEPTNNPDWMERLITLLATDAMDDYSWGNSFEVQYGVDNLDDIPDSKNLRKADRYIGFANLSCQEECFSQGNATEGGKLAKTKKATKTAKSNQKREKKSSKGKKRKQKDKNSGGGGSKQNKKARKTK